MDLKPEDQTLLKQAIRYYVAARDAGFQQSRLDRLADETIRKVNGLELESGVVVMDDAGRPWLIEIDDEYQVRGIERVQIAAAIPDPDYALPSGHGLVESAFIEAAGDPGAGVPPTEIHVYGFCIDAGAYESDAEFLSVLEGCRWKLESFAGEVCDSAVKVVFDFERKAAEDKMVAPLALFDRVTFESLVRVYNTYKDANPKPGVRNAMAESVREGIVAFIRDLLPSDPNVSVWFETEDSHRPWRVADRSQGLEFELQFCSPHETLAAAINFEQHRNARRHDLAVANPADGRNDPVED